MALKYKLLRKTELEFEIIIRGGKPGDRVEDSRTILKNLLNVEPAVTWSFMPESKKDILNSLSGLRSELKTLKINPSTVNRSILTENFESVSRRFAITSRMPEELIFSFEGISDSYKEIFEPGSCEPRDIKSTNSGTQTVEVVSEESTEDISVRPEYKEYNSAVSLESGNNKLIQEYVPSEISHRPVDVSKLRLCYDGNSCVFEFIERVEELASSRGIHHTALFRGLPELLSGGALLWFRQIKNSIASWSVFKSRLVERFQPIDYQYRLSAQIFSRSQGKCESVADYFATMSTMFSRLGRPMEEDQKLEILSRNVRPEYLKQLGLQDWDSVEKLQQFCERLELNYTRVKLFRDTPSNFLSTASQPSREVEPVRGSDATKIFNNSSSNQYSDKNRVPEANRMHNSGNNRNFDRNRTYNKERTYAIRSYTPGRPNKCYRCETTAHSGYNCPRRDVIICFRCKTPNQKMPTCSVCKAERERADSENTNNSKNE